MVELPVVEQFISSTLADDNPEIKLVLDHSCQRLRQMSSARLVCAELTVF
jgi:hypothetical protein